MIAKGVDPQDKPGDIWHPNQKFADEAAKFIVQKIPALSSAKPARARTASP
jgi:hypothetical protein